MKNNKNKQPKKQVKQFFQTRKSLVRVFLLATTVIILLVFGLFFGLRKSISDEQADAQSTPSITSRPGGFIIPLPPESSSSSLIQQSIVSSLSVSSVVQTSSAIVSTSSIAPISSAVSVTSSNPVSSGNINSATSAAISSQVFSQPSSQFQSQATSQTQSQLVSQQPFSSFSSAQNQISAGTQSSAFVSQNFSQGVSRVQQSNPQSTASAFNSFNFSSTITFDPNNPGQFHDPVKGDPIKGQPVVPENVIPPETPRTGGFSTFAIILTLIIGSIGFFYYQKINEKSKLSTKEKKLHK